MNNERLTAFSDGVIAIIIAIVLLARFEGVTSRFIISSRVIRRVRLFGRTWNRH
jgi:hypothetical protein